MKNLRMAVAVIAALGLAAGCSASTEEGSDNNGGNNNGGNGNGNDTGGLTIGVLTGLHVTNLPADGEGNGIYGAIFIERDGDAVDDATVELNGTPVPFNELFRHYDIGEAEIPAIAPGTTVTITATQGSDTATLSLVCPDEVTLDSPADGTQVTAGDQVTFKWTGKIHYDDALGKPSALILPYSSTSKFYDGTLQSTVIDGDSVTLEVPELDGRFDSWLAQLRVPGPLVQSGGSTGFCSLVRRNTLNP